MWPIMMGLIASHVHVDFEVSNEILHLRRIEGFVALVNVSSGIVFSRSSLTRQAYPRGPVWLV